LAVLSCQIDPLLLYGIDVGCEPLRQVIEPAADFGKFLPRDGKTKEASPGQHAFVHSLRPKAQDEAARWKRLELDELEPVFADKQRA
jgi:hypothetical protein